MQSQVPKRSHGMDGFDPNPAMRDEAPFLVEQYTKLIDDSKRRQLLARWRNSV